MKIGFITRKDITRENAWSGTTNFLYKVLKEKYDVEQIIIKKTVTHKVMASIIRILTWNRIKKSYVDVFFNNLEIKKYLQKKDYDLFFFPAASELLGSTQFNTKKKVVYLSDATYKLLTNYYLFNVPKIEKKIEDIYEEKSLKKASTIIHASTWAKKSAIEDYGISEKKIMVLPFGANLSDKFAKKSKALIRHKVRLLLVGVDWKRKGVDIAIKCTELLNSKNLPWKFELTIVGIDKPLKKYDKNIKFIGKLRKDVKSEEKELINYYQNSDLFILPTQAECAGIVFCEASMYGLPTIAYNTGGVSSYVQNNVTGYLLKKDSSAKDFADKIQFLLQKNLLQSFSMNARQKYENELNWDTWLKNFNTII
ncbi:glycosyltransferase family 4 protein [Liquorilactobacillus oeni]|uniref:Glycosyl transferase group 1 n=1 Tax=Liquorilactobacillus oeni DSM 19972 TaxID=1423777 RepID=A0A0R1MJ73_9LACO|nr:glycosyltransferase family 4 protein [Liquorilactobacillus oeni]KRL04531.1 glycosyl transferase group 1 [Liquorilactobacillus oeni DSM 19972]